MLKSNYVSERDFVANYLLPKLKEATKNLQVEDTVDFHIEKPIDSGISDLTVEKGGHGILVVEAKFKKKMGKQSVDIEPRDPDVIDQAIRYAVIGGFKFYATCNTKRFTLFQLIPGKKSHECEITTFEYENNQSWHEECMRYVLQLIEVRLKAIDETLVDLLHEVFIDLFPEFLYSLKEKLRNEQFKKKYIEWLSSQGIEFSEEKNRIIASQTTYLQINKLLFYQVIRQIYPDVLPPLKIPENEDIANTLTNYYNKVKTIDYEPIYESDLISEIPLTPRAKERFITLIDTLNEFDFSTMESDFLGRIYEKLIPAAERKRLGQYYTPPAIVDVIINITNPTKDALILDPACGSGTFLIRAYHKLRKLAGINEWHQNGLAETFHKQLLDQIYGIDINQFPAHLSVINLAIQNPKSKVDKMNIVVNDAFNIRAGETTLFGFQSINREGKSLELEIPRSFDLVLSNPPYIRQEVVSESEKKKIKKIIEGDFHGKLFFEKSTKNPKDSIILNKKSDIYIYFYIHGVRLLKNNGQLGFISSNKWLEVEYGEPFQQFLLRYCKILYVIEFDRAIFPDADVNTSIVILEKEKDEKERENNFVKFIRFKEKISVNEMSKIIQDEDKNHDDKKYRLTIVKQGKLKAGKWNIFLRAPQKVLNKIIGDERIKPLENITEGVFYGIKTGYNPFFILSKEDVKKWSIEKKFLKPFISSPKKINGFTITKDDVNEFLFTTDLSEGELKGMKALQYIKQGNNTLVKVTRGSDKKNRKIPELKSVSSHLPHWYTIPVIDSAQILLPKLSDKHALFLKNEAMAQASDLFYYIKLKKTQDINPLLGYLNSTFGRMLIELYGRSYGGGVLDIKVYEAKQIPTLDISKLNMKERNQLAKKFMNFNKSVKNRIECEKNLENNKSRFHNVKGMFENEHEEKLLTAKKKEYEAQKELDQCVYDILNLTEKERQQIETAIEELQRIRQLRSLH